MEERAVTQLPQGHSLALLGGWKRRRKEEGREERESARERAPGRENTSREKEERERERQKGEGSPPSWWVGEGELRCGRGQKRG